MGEPSRLELYDSSWTSHLPEIVGAIVGLASANGIYLDLRLHPLIYRFFIQGSVSVAFDDLSMMHPTLHRSLASLLKARTEDIISMCLSWTVRLPGADADYDLSGGSHES